MNRGPQPTSRAERWQRIETIADLLRRHFGAQVLALGVYGSVGRGQDEPYSDIEMLCVLRGEGIDTCYEWCEGDWKAEVDVRSPDVLLTEACAVEGDWSITHGAYVHIKPLFDPTDFLVKLRQVTLSQSEAVFQARLEEVIVGDIYELIGKIRNTSVTRSFDMLAVYAVQLAIYGACLQGLRHRHLFSSKGKMFAEALALPDAPDGLQALLHIVQKGTLNDPQQILEIADRYWAGVASWAVQHQLMIETTLANLLAQPPTTESE